MYSDFKQMVITTPTWSARITIPDCEMCEGVTVGKRKPYTKTIKQENDPTIKPYIVVERHRLPAYFVVVTPPGGQPPSSREVLGPTK
jgi:hypothetical protein